MGSDTADDALALAERFFTAIAAGDVATVADCYSDDVLVWHSFNQPYDRARGQSKVENLKTLGGLPLVLSDIRYDVVHRERTETGFVQQHVLRGTMRNGDPFALPACIICRVENGRITRLDEYFDPALSQKLVEVAQQEG